MRFAKAVFSLAMLVGCAGANEQPRQASGPDTPDPIGDSTPSSSSGGSSKSNQGKGGGDTPPMGGSGPAAKGKGGEPPSVGSLAAFTDGIKWGTSHKDLEKQFTQTGGILWKDYDEKLAKARVGPEQSALEAEREAAKSAFSRSYIEFKDIPTGYDTTGIRGEFSYKNKEALMWINRHGKKRYFFFINDRLWKMYDEVPLSDGGPMGKVFLDAVNRLNSQLNAQGRVQGPDEAKGVRQTTVDWKDGVNHLRVVDRSGESLVGLAVEDNATLSNLAALRPNKMPDVNEIDPSVLNVTRGGGPSDPNSVDAGAKKQPATPPKKK